MFGDIFLLFIGFALGAALVFVLWRLDIYTMPPCTRRHHDHLLPATPRTPRR